MRRPVLIGALAAAAIALVSSAAVAVSSLGEPSGPTMMGDQGQRTGAGMMGPGMMGSAGGMGMVWLAGSGDAVPSIPAARTRAAGAAKASGLHPGEVMWFDNGFYVELKDSSGKPATEVIVDPRSGSVTTEPGPAMMWNTRIGAPSRTMGSTVVHGTVDASEARAIATAWLAARQPSTTIATLDAYPGYFTLDLRRDGKVSGMMSVSSINGAVWYHTWHGAFIAMEDS